MKLCVLWHLPHHNKTDTNVINVTQKQTRGEQPLPFNVPRDMLTSEILPFFLGAIRAVRLDSRLPKKEGGRHGGNEGRRERGMLSCAPNSRSLDQGGGAAAEVTCATREVPLSWTGQRTQLPHSSDGFVPRRHIEYDKGMALGVLMGHGQQDRWGMHIEQCLVPQICSFGSWQTDFLCKGLASYASWPLTCPPSIQLCHSSASHG